MKNVRPMQLKKAIFLDWDEFTAIVDELYEGKAYAHYELEGFSVYTDLYADNIEDCAFEEEAITNEELSARLSEYYGVTVTSVHTDHCDYVGVWVVYKEEEPDSDTWDVCAPGNFRQVVADTLGELVDDGKVKIAKANYLDVEDTLTHMVRDNMDLIRRK